MRQQILNDYVFSVDWVKNKETTPTTDSENTVEDDLKESAEEKTCKDSSLCLNQRNSTVNKVANKILTKVNTQALRGRGVSFDQRHS